MATTPNFGWETPDDTDYVKDGAAAMRTLGNAIDASLMDLEGGTTGQVLSKNSNTDMDFVWITPNDADAIQNTIVDAKGDLISATAADTPARLAVGTNGQVLTADSTTATGLKWGNVTSKVLQVVNATYSTTVTSTSTTYADTGLTATITPTASTSTILVVVNQAIRKQGSSSNESLSLRLMRGASQVVEYGNYYLYQAATATLYGTVAVEYLDSPATTSATTYKTQFKQTIGSGTISVQNDNQYSSITLIEIGA